MMTDIPGMILWTDAYLADTKHLTTFEHGAYLLILMAMWRSGGKLANSSKRLAMLAGMSHFHWRRIEQKIMDFMTIIEEPNGSLWITQKRLQQELNLAQARNAKRVSSGSLGGLAKALKNKDAVASNASFSPLAKSKHRHTTSTSTPTKEKSLSYELGQEKGNGSATNTETDMSMSEGELKQHVAGHKVYVKQDTPAGEAWAAWSHIHLRKSQVWDAKGGWWFPTEWPPNPLSS